MYTINENYLKLRGSYLFSNIAKKVNAFSEANPEAKIIYISAKTGEGFDEWIAWLKNKLQERNA